MGHAEAVGDTRRQRRCQRVDDRRDGRTQAREAAEVADRARQRRHALARVQLRQPLHLEGRHVDAGGALGLAGLASDTGAEDLAELHGLRTVQRQRAAQQALQDVGARPGAQALVARRRRRGAHRAAELLAQAGAETPLDRQVEPALGDVAEPWPPGAVGTVLGPEAQLVGHGPAVENDAGRQQSTGVEGVLEVGEGRHEPGAQEAGQEPRARAAATVLAGDGTVVLAHQTADGVRQRVHTATPAAVLRSSSGRT